MTSADHVWSCVVNNVTHHLTTFGRVTPEPSPFSLDAENKASLSGVIIRVSDVTSALIGFHQDPDSNQSLVLSEPIFVSDAGSEARAAWFQQMLSAVIDHANQRDFSQVRFLDWESQCDAMPWIAQELKIAGFSALASVVGWKTTAEECLLKTRFFATVKLSTVDLNVSSGDPSAQISPVATWIPNASPAQKRHREIAETLDQILLNTDDLLGLPAPNAMELLQKWSSQECTLLVAEDETGVVGLCVFAFKPPTAGDHVPSGQIEYLGVRKEMQRRGIATQMLVYLCRGVSKGISERIDITAFADETNLPANLFYKRFGFEPLCRGKFWYRGLSSERH